MTNWCDHSVQIVGKKEAIDWILKHLTENAGRRWDNPDVSIDYNFKIGDEKWCAISISLRHAGSKFGEFLQTILKKFTNIHLIGYYWIEGGLGAAQYEEGTDELGNRYEFVWRINQDYFTEEELEEYQQLQKLEQDYEDYCIYLDNRPQYTEEELDIPTEDELIEDDIRNMDFDEWCDYMYKIGRPFGKIPKNLK